MASSLRILYQKGKKIGEFDTVVVTEGCVAMLHNKATTKRKDPGSFTIPCSIGDQYVG